MSFDDILGQGQAVSLLKQAIHRERMPHAWLFTGQAGIGKFKTAVALAQTLNCRENPERPVRAEDACGQCDFCLQIAEQNFPDYRVLVPEGKFIKIEQIRKSLHWLHLHPDRAKQRVMILDGAQHLGREAANAFLKTLEEPPPQTLLILIAESTHQLLETLVSRCQHVRFRPLPAEIIEQILRKNTDLSEEQIHLLNAYGMGSVRGSLAMRLELMQTVQETAIRWLASVGGSSASPPEILEEMLRTCEPWSKSKNEEWRFFLDFLETWFRDVAWLLRELPEEQTINRIGNIKPASGLSRLKALRRCGQHFTLQQSYHIFEMIAKKRTEIELNTNKALALESLCLHIHRIPQENF